MGPTDLNEAAGPVGAPDLLTLRPQFCPESTRNKTRNSRNIFFLSSSFIPEGGKGLPAERISDSPGLMLYVTMDSAVKH